MNSKEALERLLKNIVINETILITKYGYSALNDVETIKQDLKELDQYKQLEEKLGCSLITIFEALENGAWVKSKEWGLCKWGMPNIFNTYDSRYTPKSQPELQFKKSGCYEYFKIKDYGKTWSLRKEDLEDDR